MLSLKYQYKSKMVITWHFKLSSKHYFGSPILFVITETPTQVRRALNLESNESVKYDVCYKWNDKEHDQIHFWGAENL